MFCMSRIIYHGDDIFKEVVAQIVMNLKDLFLQRAVRVLREL